MSKEEHEKTDEYFTINSEPLSLRDFFDIVFKKNKIKVSDEVLKELKQVRIALEEKIKNGEVIYGVNTGFGALAGERIGINDLEKLQINLLRSHAVGVFDPVLDEIARGTLLLRILSLSKGKSGIRPQLLKLLVKFYNSGAIPLIPSRGSVGASGDLSPLSHLALAVIGDNSGAVKFNGRIYRGNELRQLLLKIYGEFIGSEEFGDVFNLDNPEEPLVKLSYKEGIALNNGTSFTASIIGFALYKLKKLVNLADLASSLTLSALVGFIDAFDERLFPTICEIDPKCQTVINIRGLVEPLDEGKTSLVRHSNDTFKLKDLIKNVRRLEDNSLELVFDEFELLLRGLSNHIRSIIDSVIKRINLDAKKIVYMDTRVIIEPRIRDTNIDDVVDKVLNTEFKYKDIGLVQDAYSLRCIPQIHGAAKRALQFAENIFEEEINIPNDNPLLFLDEDGLDIISGGNFHGQSLALAADNLALAITYIANISERRIFRLLDPNLNRGLPAFLAFKSGLNSGFMLMQYLAADLVAELRSLSVPLSVKSIPTSANQEDVVSMSATAALRLLKMIENLEYILSIEILTALQGIAKRLKLYDTMDKLTYLTEPVKNVYNYVHELFRKTGGFPIIEDTVLKSYVDTVKNRLYDIHELVF